MTPVAKGLIGRPSLSIADVSVKMARLPVVIIRLRRELASPSIAVIESLARHPRVRV